MAFRRKDAVLRRSTVNPIKLAVTLLLATFSIAAIAQNPSTPALNSRALNRIEGRLKVTPQQREQARAILQQERPALQQIRLNLAAERRELVALSANGDFDSVAAHAVAIKYADVNADAAVERSRLQAELTSILTPEQKEKLQHLRARIATSLGSQTPGFGDTL
jgi:Spy/CpxP family protein refolding chaperone